MYIQQTMYMLDYCPFIIPDFFQMPVIPPPEDDSVLQLAAVIALAGTIGTALLALYVGIVTVCCNMCHKKCVGGHDRPERRRGVHISKL